MIIGQTTKNPLFLTGYVLYYAVSDYQMVEAAGIEPASRNEDFKEPTCLVSVLSLRQEDTR